MTVSVLQCYIYHMSKLYNNKLWQRWRYIL